LQQAGGWTEILANVDVADQRGVLEPLISSVRLKRIAIGKYEPDITWTPLGAALYAVVSEDPAEAA